MLEYCWLFALFLRSARHFTGAEGKWTPLPPISLPSSGTLWALTLDAPVVAAATAYSPEDLMPSGGEQREMGQGKEEDEEKMKEQKGPKEKGEGGGGRCCWCRCRHCPSPTVQLKVFLSIWQGIPSIIFYF